MRRHAERIVKGEGEFLDLDFTLSRTVQHLTLAVVIHNGTAGGVEGAEKKHVEPIVEEKLDCIRKVLCFNDSGIPPKEYVEEVIFPALVLMKREVNEGIQREKPSFFSWTAEVTERSKKLENVRENIDKLLRFGNKRFSYNLRDAEKDWNDIDGTLRKIEVPSYETPSFPRRGLSLAFDPSSFSSENVGDKKCVFGEGEDGECLVSPKKEALEVEGDDKPQFSPSVLWLLQKRHENADRRSLKLTVKHDREVEEDDPLSENGVDVKLVPVKLDTTLGLLFLWVVKKIDEEEYLAPKETNGNYYDCPFQWVKMEEREIEEGEDLTERDGDWRGKYCIFEVLMDKKDHTYRFKRIYRQRSARDVVLKNFRNKIWRQPVCFDVETRRLQPRSRYFSKDVVDFQFEADTTSRLNEDNLRKRMELEWNDCLCKNYFREFRRFVSAFTEKIDLDALKPNMEGFEGGRL